MAPGIAERAELSKIYTVVSISASKHFTKKSGDSSVILRRNIEMDFENYKKVSQNQSKNQCAHWIISMTLKTKLYTNYAQRSANNWSGLVKGQLAARFSQKFLPRLQYGVSSSVGPQQLLILAARNTRKSQRRKNQLMLKV